MAAVRTSERVSGLNEENLVKQLSAALLLLLLLVVSSFGKEQPVIKNPAKLVGKKVNVHQIPLCQPGTDTADHTHAEKQAIVVSVKPNTMPAMSPAFTSRLTPEARALLDDQQKAATLLLQFADGTKLDTCTPIGPRGLANFLELVP
jgi:hypothetical protein